MELTFFGGTGTVTGSKYLLRAGKASVLVVNFADRRNYFSPSITYALQTNLDLTFGVQLLRGSGGSEYGRFNDAYYAQLQWFF